MTLIKQVFLEKKSNINHKTLIMSVKERIKEFAKKEKGSVKAFEESINASNGYLNSIQKSIGLDKLEAILEKYPNLNLEWLLTGNGEMIKTTKIEEKDILEVRINNQEREIQRLNTIIDIIATKLQLEKEIKITKPNYTKE